MTPDGFLHRLRHEVNMDVEDAGDAERSRELPNLSVTLGTSAHRRGLIGS